MGNTDLTESAEDGLISDSRHSEKYVEHPSRVGTKRRRIGEGSLYPLTSLSPRWEGRKQHGISRFRALRPALARRGRAVESGALVSFIVETLLDPPPSQPLPGLEVIPADLELGLARGEVTASIDGLAGVDGATGRLVPHFTLAASHSSAPGVAFHAALFPWA